MTPQKTVERVSHAELAERVDRAAHALAGLGIEQGDRVGTFAWNNQRHFELYMAIPCTGAVLHTLNVRLFSEQLVYIINHAEDRVIFLDDVLVPLMEELAPELQCVEHYVVIGDGDADGLPGALRYEELLADARPEPFDFPELDERQAAALCYTSGTTGNPKGVLYSHRSISMHSTATLMRDGTGLAREDRVLAVVPMFHANAWGLPYGAALAGSDLILPDRFLDAESLAALINAERPTLMGCVPTIFQDLLRYADEHPELDLSSLNNAACGRLGGAAVADEGLRGAPRGAHVPGLGDDRDQPRGDLLAPPRGRARRHLLGQPCPPGHTAAVGGAAPDRRRRPRGSRGTESRPVRSR